MTWECPWWVPAAAAAAVGRLQKAQQMHGWQQQ
jgi:hypothetical protein